MQAVVDPNADLIWDAVKIIETKDGDQDIRPKTDAEWIAVRNAAVAVAESGNLLMMVPRAKNGGEWMQLAQDMINTGEEAIRAADAKNAEKLFTVGGDLYDSCSNCHRNIMGAAQVSGSISGTVKDVSGGVVPGVTVTATNVALGTQFTATTDAQGFYSLPKLPVGRYDLLIQIDGFKPQKRTESRRRRRRRAAGQRDAGSRRAERNGHGHRRIRFASKRSRRSSARSSPARR